MTKEELLKGMAKLGLAYNKELGLEEIELYYEFLGKYSNESLNTAINEWIHKSRFFPKIAEIIEECEKASVDPRLKVLEYMNNKGYFKKYGQNELYKFDRPSEYERAITMVKRNIIPEGLLKDMREYYVSMTTDINQISGNERLLIGK